MLAATVDRLPTGAGWCYEPKWDGFRALAFRQVDRVVLQSRNRKPLGGYFPEVARVVRESLPAGVVLDGELIIWEGGRERTSFVALQRRIVAGRRVIQLAREHPAHYVVFDLLADPDGLLLDLPLAERRGRLEALLVGAPPQLALCPQTTDPEVALDWLRTWTATGVEGVVAKRLDGRYEPGRRGWRKVRAKSSTEAIIAGITGTLSRPETLLLGRYDTAGRLRFMGRSHPLTSQQQRELARLLTRSPQRRAGGVDHPWPQPLPATWSGQFGQPDPLPYVQVEPTVVAEIRVDTAFERDRWRHGVSYVRHRVDVSVYDVPLAGGAEP